MLKWLGKLWYWLCRKWKTADHVHKFRKVGDAYQCSCGMYLWHRRGDDPWRIVVGEKEG